MNKTHQYTIVRATCHTLVCASVAFAGACAPEQFESDDESESESEFEVIDELPAQKIRSVELEPPRHPRMGAAGLRPIKTDRPDGDGEEGAALDDVRPLGFDQERPCGKFTEAKVNAENGNSLWFCVLEDEEGDRAVTVYENGRIGKRSAIPRGVGDCALNVFLSVAPPEAKIPAKLANLDCSRTSEPGVRDLVPSESAGGQQAHRMSASNYCGSNGASLFYNERCVDDLEYNHPFEDIHFCGSAPKTWHQRTASSSYWGCFPAGHGHQQVASCNGFTAMRGWWKGSACSGSWKSWLYHDVAAGRWGNAYVTAVGAMDDYRFRGDSQPGAFHRYGVTWNGWPLSH